MGFRDFKRLKRNWAEILRRHFPERQITIRTQERVSYLKIGHIPQLMATLSVVFISGWLSFSSVSYYFTEQTLQAKDGQISNARLAYQNLMDQVDSYQKKFIAITSDLEENHATMLELVDQNTQLQQNLSNVEQELRATEAERLSVIAMRERLKSNLAEIQEDMHSLTSRNYLLRDDLNTIESDLQLVLAERNRALVEGKRLKDYANELEGRLTDLQDSQISTIETLAERANDNIAAMERVIKTAGIDVAEIQVALAGAQSGQGGPFVAVDDHLPGDALKERLLVLDDRIVHMERLQGLMESMPLAAPLITYYVTSSFGKRQDPINKKWSMHYGLDLGSTLKSPVYSTAPGTISYAGWKGKYGNLVEIDHGGGLKTRFGHLGKMHVKKGQEVGFFEKVGIVGSTGRSTGPHLHYEVVFNGKPQDPMNFIKAGRHVFHE